MGDRISIEELKAIRAKSPTRTSGAHSPRRFNVDLPAGQENISAATLRALLGHSGASSTQPVKPPSLYRASIPSTENHSSGLRPKKRRLSPEEDLHRVCFGWIGLMQQQYPILKWMMHVPNGGKRPRGEAGKLKAMGAKPGVPDLLLPRKYGVWLGLAVELKSAVGRLSVDQEDWLDAFEEDGYLTAVCRTFEDFQSVVFRYLGH